MHIYLKFKNGLAPDPIRLLHGARKASRSGEFIKLVVEEIPTKGSLEEQYICLFEEFYPEIERSASTFPPMDLTYPLERLRIPEDNTSVVPMTGEILQSKCDGTLLTRAHRKEVDHMLKISCPEEKLVFWDDCSGDTFIGSKAYTATTLFAYTQYDLILEISSYTWPSLRLLILHGSDYPLKNEHLDTLLNKNPKLHILALNWIGDHPRVRIAPLLESNAYWRGATQKGETVPVRIRRHGPERTGGIFATWRWDTHPYRPLLFQQIKRVASVRDDIHLYRYLDMDEYRSELNESKAVICPPGNGYDTHRVWETLYCGAWPIVFNTPHTLKLQKDYPSLPLIRIDKPDELDTYTLPECPSPYHPMLGEEYWTIRIQSYS